MKQKDLVKKLGKIKFSESDGFEKIISDYNAAFKEIHKFIENDFNSSDDYNEAYALEDFIEVNDLCLTYPISFSGEKIAQENIDAIENKFDIGLPPSYKKYLKKNGLIIFGDKYEKPYSMIPISKVGRLSEEYNFGIDDLEKENPELKELTDKLIVFAYGDETLQSVFHVCFNYHSLNEETGETEVFFFDQGDWPRMFNCGNAEPTQETSMDSYVRQVRDILLDNFING